jgi:hypothetical protein
MRPIGRDESYQLKGSCEMLYPHKGSLPPTIDNRTPIRAFEGPESVNDQSNLDEHKVSTNIGKVYSVSGNLNN